MVEAAVQECERDKIETYCRDQILIIADPEKCFQELISENLQILLRDRPCPEIIIVSSNFQASFFSQDKLLESVSLTGISSSEKVSKMTGCALSGINSVPIPSELICGVMPPLATFVYTDISVRYPVCKISSDSCTRVARPSKNKHERGFVTYNHQKFCPRVCKRWDISVRYRPKGVLGKDGGNNKNASEMRQTCVKNAPKWVLFYWEKRNVPKCVRNTSKMRRKCVKNARNTFGGEHLLDDTDICAIPQLQHIER